ncbi:MAG: response regulator [Myxococcota bacterium]
MSASSTPLLVRRRLLIVEDSDDDFYAFERAVRAHQDKLALIRLARGDEARDWLSAANRGEHRLPDLIILDLNMPGLNGHQVLEFIKNTEGLRHIPVVIFTTSDNPEEVEAAYDHYANAFQVKPLNYDALKAEVSSLIEYWTSLAELPGEREL